MMMRSLLRAVGRPSAHRSPLKCDACDQELHGDDHWVKIVRSWGPHYDVVCRMCWFVMMEAAHAQLDPSCLPLLHPNTGERR